MLDYSNVITFLFTMGKKYRSRPVKVCKKIESMGAGEIVINSIDLNGVMQGYDLEFVKKIREWTSLPLTVLGEGQVHLKTLVI